MRYFERLIEAARKRKEELHGNKMVCKSDSSRLTVDELKAAEKFILRCVQKKYFSDEIKVL